MLLTLQLKPLPFPPRPLSSFYTSRCQFNYNAYDYEKTKLIYNCLLIVNLVHQQLLVIILPPTSKIKAISTLSLVYVKILSNIILLNKWSTSLCPHFLITFINTIFLLLLLFNRKDRIQTQFLIRWENMQCH